MSSNLEHALYYAELGYPVFPVSGKSQPFCENGCLDASIDEAVIETWWRRWPNLNIGIHCAGCLVLDIDGADNPWPRDPNQQASLASTAVAKTPRDGRHYWFQRPPNLDLRNSAGQIAQHVDIKTDGGYVVVPPSTRDDGDYKWLLKLEDSIDQLPFPPEWLVADLEKIAKYRPDDPAEIGDVKLLRDAEPYPRLLNDAISQCRMFRETWDWQRGSQFNRPDGTPDQSVYDMSLATIAVKLGWPNQEVANLLIDFRRRSRSNPEKALKLSYMRSTIGKAVSSGEGWVMAKGVDLSGFGMPRSLPKPPPKPPAGPGEFPEHLLSPPGLLSQYVEWVTSTAYLPQPVLALAGGIALVCALAGRKIRDEAGNITKLYICGIAGSSAGKEYPQECNNQILIQSGLGKHVPASDIASEGALLKILTVEPTALLQIDEFGRFLNAAKGDRNPHLKAAATTFMKMFSSRTWIGKAYAVERQGETRQNSIQWPCPIIFGCTVPGQMWTGLEKQHLDDGFIGRFLLFQSDEYPARNRWPSLSEPPDDLLAAAKSLASMPLGEGDLASVNPEPRVIPTTEEAKERLWQLYELVDGETGKGESWCDSIWRRVEKAHRLALVYAASRDYDAPDNMVIDIAAAEWACELYEYLTRATIHRIGTEVSENADERWKQKIVAVVREHNLQKNAGMPKGKITRKTQGIKNRHTRNGYLDDLLEAGILTQELRDDSRDGVYLYWCSE